MFQVFVKLELLGQGLLDPGEGGGSDVGCGTKCDSRSVCEITTGVSLGSYGALFGKSLRLCMQFVKTFSVIL